EPPADPGAVFDRPRFDPGPRRPDGPGPEREDERRADLPPAVPGRLAVRPDHRVLLADLSGLGPGALVQRLPGGHGAGAGAAERPRRDPGPAEAWGRRDDHDRPGPAAGGPAGARQLEWSRRGARPADRRGPGHGLDAVVRPEPPGVARLERPAGGLE